MNTIKVNRKDFISKLASVKDDNVSIADVVIDRRKLVEVLRLQTQPDADVITLNYGTLSWQSSTGEHTSDVDNEPCLQFSCNHTTMRFLNRPKHPGNNRCYQPKVIPLNFVDHRAEPIKQALTGIPIDTQELIEALNFVIHGVETDGQREVLECVCFDCSKNTLQLVTADGFRLPIAKMTIKGMTAKKVLIHRLDIPKLLIFLKNNYTGKGKSKTWLDTYLDIREQKTMFISDKGMVEFDNQTGSYPNYSQLIPTTGTHIQLIASDMLESVKAVNVMARDGSGIIRLKFNRYPSNLTVSASSEEVGNSAVECQALVDRECHIAINAKYLIDYLKTCGDNIIDLFITTPSSPMVMHDGIDKSEVVMPMSVVWGK